MGIPDKRYSAADKQAMLALADQGLSGRLIVQELASNGYPPLEVKPFAAPQSSVRKIIQRERAKRAGWTRSPLATGDPRDGLDELIRRMVSTGERECLRLADAQSRGKLDLNKFKTMAGALRELSGAMGRAPGKPTPPPKQERKLPGSFASQIEADHANPPTITSHPGNGASYPLNDSSNMSDYNQATMRDEGPTLDRPGVKQPSDELAELPPDTLDTA